jgi:DNA replicative helicase MCM subunit Mcm2 (Cdc46/Mcm family)
MKPRLSEEAAEKIAEIYMAMRARLAIVWHYTALYNMQYRAIQYNIR